MFKKLAPLLLFNALVGLFFILSNTYVWSLINRTLTSNEWNPLQIFIAPQMVSDGHTSTVGLNVPFPNYPFILFWVLMVETYAFPFILLEAKKKM